MHAVRIAHDGLVYVCDRTNDRLQVFRKDGSFVKEAFIARQTLGKDGEPRTAVPLAHDGEAGGAVLIGTAMNDGLAGDTGSDLLIAGASGPRARIRSGGTPARAHPHLLRLANHGNETFSTTVRAA